MHRILQHHNELHAVEHLTVADNVVHRETYESLINRLSWLDESFMHSEIPTTKNGLWRALTRDQSNLVYAVYCTLCKEKVGDGKRATRLCTCRSTGPGLRNKNMGTLILVKILPQLLDIFKLLDISKSLRYRGKRIQKNDCNIEDIYDGNMYKVLLEDGNFLSFPNNFSLTLWVDGVSLAKSSNSSSTPILMQINELPPYARCKHFILAGIYVGNHKPNISSIMFPIIQQLMIVMDISKVT